MAKDIIKADLGQELQSTQDSENYVKQRENQENAVKLRIESNVMAITPNSSPMNPERPLADVIALLDQKYLHRNTESCFAKPEKYMKEVRSDCMYSWARKGDPYLRARLRSGYYRRVLRTEIREDTEVPIDFKELAGVEVVQVGDLVLVEVQPHAVKELYLSRAAEGYLNAQNNIAYSQLESNVAQAVARHNGEEDAIRTEIVTSITQGDAE